MTTTRARIAGLALLGSALLLGCLFPSFDDLGANGSAATDRTDGGTPASTATTSPTTSPTTTPTTSPTTPVDGGPDATTTTPRVPNGVRCLDRTCGGTKYCCANMILDVDDCRDQGDDPDLLCAAQAAGDARAMRCDGPEDCPGTTVCCFVDREDQGASCAATCAGTTLCHDGTQCPAGKTCSGALFNEYMICR